jgi:hypothetical protein
MSGPVSILRCSGSGRGVAVRAGWAPQRRLWRKGDRLEFAGPAGDVDERSWFVDEGIDFSPATHEDLELPPGAAGVFAGEVDHLGAVRAHGVDLGKFLMRAPGSPGYVKSARSWQSNLAKPSTSASK